MELLQQRVDKRMAALCYRLQQRLYRGSSLAQAMEQERDFFPELAVSLVAAGEESGELGKALEELAAYYTRQAELKRFVIKTALYPAFLLTAALLVALFFLLYVLPALASAYASMQLKPRGTLALLLQAGEFLQSSPGAACAGAVLLALGIGAGLRLLFRRLAQHPQAGNFYQILNEVRFCKLLALLLDSGISITKAVMLISSTMEQQFYRRQLALLQNRLEQGTDISIAFSGADMLFSPLTMDLLRVGAATGCLPQMLREAAAIGEQDLQEKLARLKEYLAPALLLLAALMVAVVVCAVVGPLLEMVSALPE